MAQTIISLCDSHLNGEDSEEVRASTQHTISIDGRGYTIDLCAECDARLIGGLAWVESIGASVKRGGAERAPYRSAQALPAAVEEDEPVRPCPVCTRMIFGKSGKFATHMQGAHDIIPSDYFGLVCPVCAWQSSNAAGMGVHGQSHGVASVADAFALAAREGDPHGIVAERRRLFAARSTPDLLSESTA